MEKVKILSIEHATHDVMHLKIEKPKGINYVPGQAVDVALAHPEWEKELRAFTFTSLPTDDYLEFFIKTYPERKSVTSRIRNMAKGEELLIGDVFGDIAYKGEGIFIAGGAGITPFIAILKDLEKRGEVGNNKLIFANKTSEDIVEHDFFQRVLGANFVNVLSNEKKEGYKHGYVNKELIQSQVEGNAYIYLCGPPPMMDAVVAQLEELGIDKERVIKEPF